MPYLGALSEASNRASYVECIEVIDQETGEPVDISTAQEIVFQVVSPVYDNYYRLGYGVGVGGGYSGAAMLIASLSNGKIQHVQTGVFQVAFTRSEMNTLPGADYNVGVAITKDDQTSEIIIGTLPVREGIVTVSAGSA